VARRALTTSLAALGAVAVPIALVALSAGASPDPIYAARSSSTGTSFLEGQLQLVRARTQSDAVTFQDLSSPVQATAVASATALAPTTTTTAAPTPAPAPAPPPPPAPAPPPPPAPAPAPSGAATGDPNDPASWDRLARCESGGNWAINSGNGYYGGLQFSLASWRNVGGTGYPHEHTRETQIEMGKRLHAQGGWRHWPGCARSFGWI
jgi:hypothetical protein